MTGFRRALFAGVAAACIGGAAHADEGTMYYYYGNGTTGAYSESFAPSTSYYYSSHTGATLVTPVPHIYYAPAYTVRSNTTYYHSGSTHNARVGASAGYTTFYEPRLVYGYTAPAPTYYYRRPVYAAPAEPYGYTPPGLSITTRAGIYAPVYGGWNSYSAPSAGNDGYRYTNY